jgi:hypothetical protein
MIKHFYFYFAVMFSFSTLFGVAIREYHFQPTMGYWNADGTKKTEAELFIRHDISTRTDFIEIPTLDPSMEEVQRRVKSGESCIVVMDSYHDINFYCYPFNRVM